MTDRSCIVGKGAISLGSEIYHSTCIRLLCPGSQGDKGRTSAKLNPSSSTTPAHDKGGRIRPTRTKRAAVAKPASGRQPSLQKSRKSQFSKLNPHLTEIVLQLATVGHGVRYYLLLSVVHSANSFSDEGTL